MFKISWIEDVEVDWPDYLTTNPVPDEYVLDDGLTFDGTVKQQTEDFKVTEILSQEPSGSGPNTFIRVQKRDISTLEVIQVFAEFLDRDEEDFCTADYKGRKSVSIQWISLEHLDPRALNNFQHEKIRIIKITRNDEKLKPVDLEGDRYEITLRDTDDDALEKLREGFTVLGDRGVPNWFSGECFGYRQTHHNLGWALITKQWDLFLKELLDQPHDGEDERVASARESAGRGDWERAQERFPRSYRAEREALESLVRYPENRERAVEEIPAVYRDIYLSAIQGFAFNAFLEERLETYDQLIEGDVAFMHDTSGCFPVMDPDDERPRLDRFEISPTGPLYGEKSLGASDQVGELEDEILERCGLTYEDFQRSRYPVQGRRRPLRLPVSQVSLQELEDDTIEVGFVLPRNSYALTVIEEIMHTRIFPDVNEF